MRTPEPMTPLLGQLCLLATRVNTLEHAADPHDYWGVNGGVAGSRRQRESQKNLQASAGLRVCWVNRNAGAAVCTPLTDRLTRRDSYAHLMACQGSVGLTPAVPAAREFRLVSADGTLFVSQRVRPSRGCRCWTPALEGSRPRPAR
jgi:hypothetical protein